jgi:hypothetical protein
MRITTLDHTHIDNTVDGLAPFKLSGLKRVVLLAGPNGSGKSRLLRRIWSVNESITDCEGNQAFLTHLTPQQREALHDPRHGFRVHRLTQPKGIGLFEGKHREANLSLFSIGLMSDLTLRVTGTVEYPRLAVVILAPTPNFQDPYQLQFREMADAAKDVQKPGNMGLHRGGLAYVHQIQNRWWNATHTSSTAPAEERSAAIKAYNDLDESIDSLLTARLVGQHIRGAG